MLESSLFTFNFKPSSIFFGPLTEILVCSSISVISSSLFSSGLFGISNPVFDHSSCGSAEIIKVKNKISGRTNGSITCKPGNTTIKGMDFKNLFLLTDHLDKSDYPELKEKDAMILDLVLLNHVRQNCERTKLAYGDFEILRKIPTGKKVSSAYYLILFFQILSQKDIFLSYEHL